MELQFESVEKIFERDRAKIAIWLLAVRTPPRKCAACETCHSVLRLLDWACEFDDLEVLLHDELPIGEFAGVAIIFWRLLDLDLGGLESCCSSGLRGRRCCLLRRYRHLLQTVNFRL